MAATREMVHIACKTKPHMVTLVPEGRREITTEGGLDISHQVPYIKEVVGQLHAAGIAVSAFIDPDQKQVESAADSGFKYCEIHTGPYAHAFHAAGGDPLHPTVHHELAKIAQAGNEINNQGMHFNAGHALNYRNVVPITALPGIRQLHIGHSIISRAIFVGLRTAVAEMKQLLIK
jgi:pyridoxine 5-phosphate synthase